VSQKLSATERRSREWAPGSFPGVPETERLFEPEGRGMRHAALAARRAAERGPRGSAIFALLILLGKLLQLSNCDF